MRILNTLGYAPKLSTNIAFLSAVNIFKFVALCKLNAIHIKQLKRKTYI